MVNIVRHLTLNSTARLTSKSRNPEMTQNDFRSQNSITGLLFIVTTNEGQSAILWITYLRLLPASKNNLRKRLEVTLKIANEHKDHG